MKCLSNGTPTPSTRLTRLIGPTHFEQLINQTHTVEGKTEEVSFTIDQVPCESSGVLRCDANNSIGQVRENRTLLVSCMHFWQNMPIFIAFLFLLHTS